MARTSKKAPPRKAVKPRGAIPVPKTAPKRDQRPWHQRSGFRIVGALIALAVILTIFKLVNDARARGKTNKQRAAAIQQLDRQFSVMQSPLTSSIVPEMGQAPKDFAAGKLSKDEYLKKADAWLEEFRKVDKNLRKRQIPADFIDADQARAWLVDGNLIYIDAVKTLKLAAGSADPAVRDEAIKQASNQMAHAASITAAGQQAVNNLKIKFGLQSTAPGQPEPSPAAFQLPSEESASAPAAAPTGGAAQTLPPPSG